MAESQKEATGEEPIPRPAAGLSHEEENENHPRQGANRQQTELEATIEDELEESEEPEEPEQSEQSEQSEESDMVITAIEDEGLLQYVLRENRRLRAELQTTKEELRNLKEQYGTPRSSLEEN